MSNMYKNKIQIKQINSSNTNLYQKVLDIDRDSFKDVTITIWTLESFARFGRLVGIFLDNSLIGFAIVMRELEDKNSAYLVEMAVEEKYNNQGYGTQLLHEVIEQLKKFGVSRVLLHVDPKNFNALHIYTNIFNFRACEYRENEYGIGKDRLLMELNLINQTTKRIIPWLLIEDDYACIRKAHSISRSLRRQYYETTKKNKEPYTKPLHGFLENGLVRESLGPFPEFILPTHPCDNSRKGFCSPCFFSKLPLYECSSEIVYESLLIQTKYIIDNYQDVLMRYQIRPPGSLDRFDAVFCYATNGSFFSNSETLPDHRLQALSMLAQFAKIKKLNVLMYLETCAGDYIRSYNNGELNKLLPLLKDLNALILVGLESINDYTRNVIYNKNLPIGDFYKVLEINRQIGLETGAFVFSGFHSMIEREIVRDVEKTLFYLKREKVMPVLMFPNLKNFSLLHLLYRYNRYNLIDPRTCAKLMTLLYREFETSEVTGRDKWLTGDVWGGPPASAIDMFSNNNKVSCDYCSKIIADAAMRLRVDHDIDIFTTAIAPIHYCENNCDEKYNKYINGIPDKSLRQRTRENILFAEKNVPLYMKELISDGYK